MTIVPGTKLGRYEIRSKIGEGGMGEVYLAQDPKLERKVAIKVLPARSISDEKAKGRLLKEARAAAKLDHPNICAIHEVGEADEHTFIVMQYIEGETLYERTKRQPLDLAEELCIITQVADALAEAHAHGVVHRDIKPSNIIISPRGQAKVMDFGLAKLVTESVATEAETMTLLTSPGTVMGTTAYMSPEQARGQNLDGRSDIFSLGVVLYELVAGRKPFPGETAADVIASILKAEPPALGHFGSEVPSELQRIAGKALRKDREERYQTIDEMLDDLKNLSQEIEFEARRKRGAASTLRRPETKYAHSGDVNIAYQVLGNGPIDLVYVMGWVTNLDYFWEEPSYARFLKRLASFSRLILFDKRGTGLSDRVNENELPTLEQRMDDVRAVMDAVSSTRAVLFGVSEGGPMCALFAATYPERTSGLMMYGSYAKRIWSPDYPWAPTPDERQKFFDLIQQGWGGVVDVEIMAPSRANDESFREWWATYLRRSASPGSALAFARMNTEIDIRHVLPTIRTPTLVLHRTGDLDADVAGGRYIAERVPGANYIEFPSNDHLPFVGEQDAILDEIEKFLVGIRHAPELDRVLATVLCLNVIGPTVGRSNTRQQWPDSFLELATNELQRFRGRKIKTSEKTLLAAFDGPARAVRAARSIGDSARRLGIEIKAGLHTGECDVVDEEIAGIAVEISAQVAARAHAGEVLVSSTVKDLVAGSGIRFEDRGARQLKGVEGKWRLFAVVEDGNPGAVREAAYSAPVRSSRRARPIDSLAILPLANAGADPNMEYLSDGITESIINTLSQLPRLKVMARSTVFRYKGAEVDPRQVGRDLGVRAVLTGRVLQMGERLIIGTELVDVADGSQLWGEQYHRAIADIFELQAEISRQISEKLRLKLSGAEKKRLTKRHTKNSQAYELYLKGRFFWNKRTEEDAKRGIDCFHQALLLDRNFALAYAGLADCQTLLGDVGIQAMLPKEAFSQGQQSAARALELDELLPEAHGTMGHIHMHLFDWSAAEREFRRALDLNPNFAQARLWYAYYLAFTGRFNDSITIINSALQLDPLSPPVNRSAAELLYFAGRFDEAIDQFHTSMEMDSHYLAHLELARVYECRRMYEAAFVEFAKARELSHESPECLASLAHCHAVSGTSSEAQALLRDLIKLSEQRYVSPYDLALIHHGLDEKEECFKWLNRAYEIDDGWMIYITVDPRWQGLRADPAFIEIVQRVGLRLH